MAHNIENNKYFGVNQPAWHGLGTTLSEAPTPEEAWRLACPHVLFKVPIQWAYTDLEGNTETGPAPEHCAIVRDDGRVLGVHSNRYEPVQPSAVFDRYRPLIDSGLVTLETGGTLNDGKRMWVLGKVAGADAEIVPGDPIRGYVLFQESWDGSLCAGAGLTSVRVVCANTLAMAQGDVTMRAKHTRGVHAKLDSYRDEIARVLHGFRENVEAMRTLARKQVTRAAQEVYIREVIAGPESLEKDAEISARTENKVDTVINLLDTQRGLELVPAIRGTAWQAYNAVSEYLTHDHGRDAESRLASQWFGQSAKINTRALQAALAL